MVVNQAHAILTPINQYICTEFVNHTRNALTVFKHFLNRAFRKNFAFCSGMGKMMAYVFAGARSVHVVKCDSDIDSLTDRGAFPKIQLLPKFSLSGVKHRYNRRGKM